MIPKPSFPFTLYNHIPIPTDGWCPRYSLAGGVKTVPVPYLPADTARSVSSTSEYQGSRAHSRAAAAAHRPASRASKQRGSPTTSGSTSGTCSINMKLLPFYH